jgi:hypothetical protein
MSSTPFSLKFTRIGSWWRQVSLVALVSFSLLSLSQAQETILQYFNTKWTEIERRMPEIAEAGYGALWLPPVYKGASGGFSVGYDPYDRFDLGDKNQSGTLPTKYGTKEELLRLIRTAHRFGLRVYLDNVTAHNGGPLDNVAASTLLPQVPGFVPEDFHLVRKTGGGWKKATDSIDYNDEWQVLHRNPFGWDIAYESPNTSFDPTGMTEGLDFPKWTGLRHAGQPRLYLDTDVVRGTNGQGQPVYGFNGTAGDPVAEDVNTMMLRSTRWLIDETKCDGFRLDAVKHVPSYFFGQQTGADKDQSGAGFIGQIQEQFNITHGYTDWSNHRNSYFDLNAPRDDAMIYGEHLGAPPNPTDYLIAGMKIANDDFLNRIGGASGIGSSFTGLDSPGQHTYGVNEGVMYCVSHDNASMAASERPSAHQYMLTRSGLAIVYTDGYNFSSAPDFFPKRSETPFLGQFGSRWVTGPLTVRQDLIRGQQIPKWGDTNFGVWELRDKSENPSMSDAAGTVALIMHARRYATSGQLHDRGQTTFPIGARLRNYSEHNGPFAVTVGNDRYLYNDQGQRVTVSPGAYFAFSWATPQLPTLWATSAPASEPAAIELWQGTERCPTMPVTRRDGRDGDPAYDYSLTIPRVTDGSALSFIARADGSAENILLKLDGGVDLNSAAGLGPQSGDLRDHRPSEARETFLGYEQMAFRRRVAEKFAASDISRNVIGSLGAESWRLTIGSAQPPVRVDAATGLPSSATGSVGWLYHDPLAAATTALGSQISPLPTAASDQPLRLRVKVGYDGTASRPDKVWLYYTTDGTTFPEGSSGLGRGPTLVAEATWVENDAADGTGVPLWYEATLPAQPANRVLTYKWGATRFTAPSQFPQNAAATSLKDRMESIFALDHGWDATSATVYPHNNKAQTETGLREGFHILRARRFLSRTGQASLYSTTAQSFYYDLAAPTGLILFPAANDETLAGSTYGAVVVTDETVTSVSYTLLDALSTNDGPGNGATQWKEATEAVATQLGSTGMKKEWRFDLTALPYWGEGRLRVRLREASSSTNNALSDTTGHFTTLERQVNFRNDPNFRIGFPTADGQRVSAGYVAKALFHVDLGRTATATPIPDATLLSEFTVTLDGLPLPASSWSYVRNEAFDVSALAVTLPSFYSGNPQDSHLLKITHTRGDITLSATRSLLAEPGAILDADSDGLPDFWEGAQSLDPSLSTDPHGANGDPDGDGLSNLAEYLFGLSAQNAADGCQVPSPAITRTGTQLQLSLPILPDRSYQLMDSADLITWTPLQSAQSFSPTQTGPATWLVTPASDRRFYRVRAARRP